MEIDHLLVTKRNIFVIETKYKSGTVHAREGAPYWKVIRRHGDTTEMRNALDQAKNTCKQIHLHLGLPARPIPIVVITSDNDNTSVITDASNVVTPDRLPAIIQAFEEEFKNRLRDIDDISRRIDLMVDKSPGAKERHNERVLRARNRADQRSIIENSSTQ